MSLTRGKVIGGIAGITAVVVVSVVMSQRSDGTPPPCVPMTFGMTVDENPDATSATPMEKTMCANIYDGGTYCDITGTEWCVIGDEFCMTNDSDHSPSRTCDEAQRSRVQTALLHLKADPSHANVNSDR